MRAAAAVFWSALLGSITMGGAGVDRALGDGPSTMPRSIVSPPAASGPAALVATAPAPQYWIGIAVTPIPPAMRQMLTLPDGEGLLVADVIDNSPAKVADIHVGDLLVEFDKAPLHSAKELLAGLNPVAGGLPTAHEIRLIRQLGSITVHVTPAERPATLRMAMQSGERLLLPDGSYLNVGPGYKVDGRAADAEAVVRSIERSTQNGQTMIVSQRTNGAGETISTIAVGDQVYRVTTPESVAALPAELQPLGKALLCTTPAATQRSDELDDKRRRLKALQDETHRLEAELETSATKP